MYMYARPTKKYNKSTCMLVSRGRPKKSAPIKSWFVLREATPS